MLIGRTTGRTLDWTPPSTATTPAGPAEEAMKWQGMLDRHNQMQDKLREIARTYQGKAVKLTALAALGAAAGVGVALAGLPVAGLYLGIAGVAGAGLFAARSFSVAREARERHQMASGSTQLFTSFLDQYRREADEQQRQQIGAQLELMASRLGGGGGGLRESGGVLTVGGARLRQRGS